MFHLLSDTCCRKHLPPLVSYYGSQVFKVYLQTNNIITASSVAFDMCIHWKQTLRKYSPVLLIPVFELYIMCYRSGGSGQQITV